MYQSIFKQTYLSVLISITDSSNTINIYTFATLHYLK